MQHFGKGGSAGQMPQMTDTSWSDFNLRGGDCAACVEGMSWNDRTSTSEGNVSKNRSFSVTEQIAETLQGAASWDLDDLAQVCSPFTWNQVFLEIDRLSRRGDVLLNIMNGGRYCVTPVRRELS